MRAHSLLSLVAAAAAHDLLAVNPALGVPGFPDCVRARPELEVSVEEAALDLVCQQRPAAAGAIKIGCVGDSITAGAHSSGGSHTYPSQLQQLLDAAHGEGAYSVTNLGACGSTMLKDGDSPYWQRPQYTALTQNTWDIVVIMLGTNDAKDTSSGHPSDNWKHDCGGPEATSLTGCSFATDYKALVEVVRGLGTTADGPEVYAMTPPPLMQQGVYGMNQTVINSVYPKLVSLIQQDDGVKGPIDVFTGMGGVADWQGQYPADGCKTDTAQPASCRWYCDAQSCDQCHPNDNGYTQLAKIVQAGLGLTSSIMV